MKGTKGKPTKNTSISKSTLEEEESYWESIRPEMRLHRHIHIHKGIGTMLEVRWSRALLALPFIIFLLLFGSYKQHGITLIPLWTSIVALF